MEGLDRRLSALDARYDLVQVKQKLGGLRYYIQTGRRGSLREMEVAVLDAEDVAERTCELCGDEGVLHISARGWLCTLCSEVRKSEEPGLHRRPEVRNRPRPQGTKPRNKLWHLKPNVGIRSVHVHGTGSVP